jgi:membrane-associated protease RseP (regulator of RpoE activity)
MAGNPYLGYEIAAAAVLAYAIVLYGLHRAGYLGPERTLSLFGPALMIKTKRGLAAIDRWGRFRRFWTRAADLGIVLAAVAMASVLVLLLIDAVIAFRLTPSEAPQIQEALGIPGLNPIIPIGYGIVALVIGVVLHELAHGVVARSQGIGVKTIGVLVCVVPVGAFVEQNDADMMAAPRRQRDRVAAAGVLANFFLFAVFFVALSAVVSTSVAPNANGVGVLYVEPGTPAANATIAPGDIITSLNGTATPTLALFEDALANTTPGETISVAFYATSSGSIETTSIPLAPSPTIPGRGFLGVSVSFLTPAELKQTLVNPFGSSFGPYVGAADWIVLPLATLQPIAGTTATFYHVTGPLGAAGSGTFWIGANLLYWLAWMNLLLGVSNALPLVPLDGGLLFRDFAASIAARFRRGLSSARLDEIGARAAVVSSFLVLVLLAWQFVVPRL